MRLSCPNCQTEYDVPDAALTGRARTLRCAKCMAKWQIPALDRVLSEPEPVPAAVEPATEPSDAVQRHGAAAVIEEAEPAAVDEDMAGDAAEIAEGQKREWVNILHASPDRSATVEPQPPVRRGLRLSILLVLLIIAVVLAAHRPIGTFWPPSLRLFGALGLH